MTDTLKAKAAPRKRAPRAKTAAKASAPSAPSKTVRYVRHSKRPDWGIGRVVDEFVGLLRVRFSDGVSREFRDSVLEPVDVSALTAEELATVSAPDVPKPAPAPTRVPRARAAVTD